VSTAPRLVGQDDCGCRHFVDARGREIIEQCVADRALSNARHQAAIQSGSHVYRVANGNIDGQIDYGVQRPSRMDPDQFMGDAP
jgi:hypothetical protein